MASARLSDAPPSHDDDPLYLRVIDLGGRTALCYSAVALVAVVTDMVRGDGLTFRSWASFAVQSVAAFVLATIVVRRTLVGWKHAGSRFVPASIAAAALGIGVALGLGTLAGGFFPDALGYRRRSPELFFRTVAALMPTAVAVYLALRSAVGSKPAPAPVAAPPVPTLSGTARDAALRALDRLDRGEVALTAFQQEAVTAGGITSVDAERLRAALDGPGFVSCLREMPPHHPVTNALRGAVVAQTDVLYLSAFARGAHDAVGHTAESAREFIAEVGVRHGLPGADVESLAAAARTVVTTQRTVVTGLLQASRFGPPSPDR